MALLVIGLIVFWVWALIDCAMTPSAACRTLPKVAWVILIVLFGALAAAGWLLLGRPQRTEPRARRVETLRMRPPPPDARPHVIDRPEISDRRSRELDEQLARWELEQGRRRELGPGEVGPGEVAADEA